MDEQVRQKIQSIHEQIFKIEVKVEEGGKLPTKAHNSDCGFDLFSTEDIVLYPGQSGKTPLNIRLKLPPNTYAEITTKSGLGSRGHSVRAGIIDEGYRGVIHVIHSNVALIAGVDSDGFPLMLTEPLKIAKGDKIAQLIIHAYNSQFYITQVEEIDVKTDRGEGGFGSSGPC